LLAALVHSNRHKPIFESIGLLRAWFPFNNGNCFLLLLCFLHSTAHQACFWASPSWWLLLHAFWSFSTSCRGETNSKLWYNHKVISISCGLKLKLKYSFFSAKHEINDREINRGRSALAKHQKWFAEFLNFYCWWYFWMAALWGCWR